MKVLAVVSGGLDSVTLAWWLAARGELARILSFDYGQRHVRELESARQTARTLNVPHHVIDLSGVAAHLTGSALTDPGAVAVPDGHYTQATMKSTVVPNRNAILLAVAFGMAASSECDGVAAAFHGGDHYIYPDCRPDFVAAFDAMEQKSLGEDWHVRLLAPFVDKTKADIVRLAQGLGVPLEQTWSCYKGGTVHCGRCGTCVERQEAFALAGVADTTVYADTEFWRVACRK